MFSDERINISIYVYIMKNNAEEEVLKDTNKTQSRERFEIHYTEKKTKSIAIVRVCTKFGDNFSSAVFSRIYIFNEKRRARFECARL